MKKISQPPSPSLINSSLSTSNSIKPTFTLGDSVNIIIKPERIPSWRPFQRKVGVWQSKHKDGVTTSAHLTPQEQFSPEEMRKIETACRHTNAMGNPSLEDPCLEE